MEFHDAATHKHGSAASLRAWIDKAAVVELDEPRAIEVDVASKGEAE